MDAGTLLILIIAGLVFLIAVGIVVFSIVMFRKNKIRVIVFENLGGGGYRKAFEDRARVIKIGDSGEEVLFLRKKKVYRTAYGRKMSNNTYWFAIGQDGYWYNITLGDLDAKKGMLDIEPIDRDMRYMHVAIRKNTEARYRKQKFMEKYGTIVINGIFLIIMVIGIIWALSKMGDVADKFIQAGQYFKDALATNQQIYSQITKLCTQSGITPIG